MSWIPTILPVTGTGNNVSSPKKGEMSEADVRSIWNLHEIENAIVQQQIEAISRTQPPPPPISDNPPQSNPTQSTVSPSKSQTAPRQDESVQRQDESVQRQAESAKLTKMTTTTTTKQDKSAELVRSPALQIMVRDDPTDEIKIAKRAKSGQSPKCKPTIGDEKTNQVKTFGNEDGGGEYLVGGEDGLCLNMGWIHDCVRALEESQGHLLELLKRRLDLQYAHSYFLESSTKPIATKSPANSRWKCRLDVMNEQRKLNIDMAVANRIHAQLLEEMKHYRPEILYWIRSHLMQLHVGSHVWLKLPPNSNNSNNSNNSTRCSNFNFARYVVHRLHIKWNSTQVISGEAVLIPEAKPESEKKSGDTMAVSVHYDAEFPDTAALNNVGFLPSPSGSSQEQNLLRALFPNASIVFL